MKYSFHIFVYKLCLILYKKHRMQLDMSVSAFYNKINKYK